MNRLLIVCQGSLIDGTLYNERSQILQFLSVIIPCLFTEFNFSLMTLRNALLLYINAIQHLSYVFRRDSSSARQEIPCILWSPNVRSRVHKSSQHVPVPNLINSVHDPILRHEDQF